MLINIAIPLLAVFISVFATFYFTLLRRPRKQLGYQISEWPGFYASDFLKDDLVIKYENEIVKNLYIYNIEIRNDGNVPIENQVVSFTINDVTKYISYGYDTNFSDKFEKIEAIDVATNDIRRFRIPLLNPKEAIFFKFIFANLQSHENMVRVDARAPGLSFHKLEEKTGSNILLTTILFFFLLIFPLIGLIVILLGKFYTNLLEAILIIAIILAYDIFMLVVTILSGLRLVKIRKPML